ncbi:MAG: hypothetical protein U0894_06960 [Pirellulales bacterium]
MATVLALVTGTRRPAALVVEEAVDLVAAVAVADLTVPVERSLATAVLVVEQGAVVLDHVVTVSRVAVAVPVVHAVVLVKVEEETTEIARNESPACQLCDHAIQHTAELSKTSNWQRIHSAFVSHARTGQSSCSGPPHVKNRRHRPPLAAEIFDVGPGEGFCRDRSVDVVYLVKETSTALAKLLQTTH